MAIKAYQRIYTRLDAITKATVSLKAKGVTNDELAVVHGRLAQVVKTKGDLVTLQVFSGTEGIPTDAEITFTATYSGTDTHDMVICYSEVDYISFKNAYLKNNINSIPTSAMTHSGDTYTGTVAVDSSKLYYVFLAFLNDDGEVNTSAMSHVTLTYFDYHGNVSDYTVKGAIWAVGMVAVFFFIVLGVTTFMRMRLAATRKKMEAQGRLYPQGYGRCNFCGAIVLPGQVNCPKCGAYIDRPESMKPHKKDYFVCSVCGCEVSPDMKECPKCGAQFDGEENVVTHKDGTSDVSEETKTCPNCGKSIPANSARCPNCGKKVEIGLGSGQGGDLFSGIWKILKDSVFGKPPVI